MDPSDQDNYAIKYAYERGHFAIVRLLLGVQFRSDCLILTGHTLGRSGEITVRSSCAINKSRVLPITNFFWSFLLMNHLFHFRSPACGLRITNFRSFCTAQNPVVHTKNGEFVISKFTKKEFSKLYNIHSIIA